MRNFSPLCICLELLMAYPRKLSPHSMGTSLGYVVLSGVPPGGGTDRGRPGSPDLHVSLVTRLVLLALLPLVWANSKSLILLAS